MKQKLAHRSRAFGVATLVLCSSFPAYAWDGYDWDSGSFIEIERGNKVRHGLDIEYFDYSAGEYRNAEVVEISRSGHTVEVEVIDQETGEYRVFEMED